MLLLFVVSLFSFLKTCTHVFDLRTSVLYQVTKTCSSESRVEGASQELLVATCRRVCT